LRGLRSHAQGPLGSDEIRQFTLYFSTAGDVTAGRAAAFASGQVENSDKLIDPVYPVRYFDTSVRMVVERVFSILIATTAL
jgi:hypothetical protein